MIELPFIKNRPRFLWKYEANGVFWKIIPADDQYLVLEDRNKDSKIVEYVVLDYLTGKECWRKSFHEIWWIGIEIVYYGAIIFHGYASPELPEHKGVQVVDLKTGKVLWSDINLKYLFCYSGKLVAEQRSNFNIGYVECEMQNCDIIARHDECSVRSLQQKSIIPVPKSVVYPESNDLNPLESTKEIIMLKKKISGFNLTEYIEVDKMMVIAGYYLSSDIDNRSTFNQDIIIINKDKNKIIYQDTVIRSANYPVRGIFLLIENIILYLKDHKILNALEIK
ncbi:MAG: DUF4905 domain-containing protein [Ignavibacteriales bacterium]|nr:DUF4905 domain-containing protein [Ignavibacteriales bacterium]